MPREPTWTLSVMLSKPGLTSPAQVLKNLDGLQHEDITIGGAAVGTAFFKQLRPTPPRWLQFLADACSVPALVNGSSGAVVLLQHADRAFVLSFGYARDLVNPAGCEERFGLKVTLNSVAFNQLRSVDMVALDTVGRQTRTQSARLATVEQFGLNIDRDLLRAVTGVPADELLGRSMTGRDALRVSTPCTMRSLLPLLRRFADKFGEETYKEHFAWIDHIAEVQNRATIEELDEKLLANFKAGDFDRLWIAVPEIIEWERIAGFRYGSSRRAQPESDLRMSDLLESFRDPQAASVSSLKSKLVVAVSAESDLPAYEPWTAYRCLYCEIERENELYVLSNGKWFKVDADFVQTVNAGIRDLFENPPITLPDYTVDDEKAYNLGVAASSYGQYLYVDRKLLVHGGGGSRFEFCDLLGRAGELIHVKRYGGSEVLSHLFAQGVNAAQLWYLDEDYRNKMGRLIPEVGAFTAGGVRPASEHHPIVFCVISRSPKDLRDFLPFFAKLTLRNGARELKSLGYPVHVIKVLDRTLPRKNKQH